MNSTKGIKEPYRCMGCRHPIRAAESIAAGYGKGCRAKVRQAAKQADLTAWTASQIEDAREVIADGGVVPSTRPGVFHVVSTDGREVYRTHRDDCNCTSGLKTRQPRPCFHRCAVTIVLASQAPAVKPSAAPVIALTGGWDPASLWAEIERLNDAFMAVA